MAFNETITNFACDKSLLIRTDDNGFLLFLNADDIKAF